MTVWTLILIWHLGSNAAAPLVVPNLADEAACYGLMDALIKQAPVRPGVSWCAQTVLPGGSVATAP